VVVACSFEEVDLRDERGLQPHVPVHLLLRDPCLIALPGAPEGSRKDSRDPSPLFKGFESYRTLDELKAQLPRRSRWVIVADSKIPARKDCLRFDELTFAFPATDMGYDGRLQLTFINERLKWTSLTPADFPGFVEALRRTGVVFQSDGRAVIRPRTSVWLWDGEPRFVGWADQRFEDETKAWVYSCS